MKCVVLVFFFKLCLKINIKIIWRLLIRKIKVYILIWSNGNIIIIINSIESNYIE